MKLFRPGCRSNLRYPQQLYQDVHTPARVHYHMDFDFVGYIVAQAVCDLCARVATPATLTFT